MTNKEYIQSIMSRVGANANDTTILFAENPTLNPIAQLTLIDCEKALYDSFCSWIPMFESVSEGDMTVKWNWNAIRMMLGRLAEKLNLPNPLDENKPTVTAIDPWGQ